MKFCPKCGATDKDFYKGFCIDCYTKTNVFADIPDNLKITRCKDCGFWLYKGAWVEDLHQNLLKMISEKTKTVLFDPKFEADLKDRAVALKLSGFADEWRKIPVKVQKEIRIQFDEKTCETCLKFNGKNYEVKIQLRRSHTFDAVKYKKVSTFIKRSTNFIMRKDERARPFWQEEKKEGTDFFFGFRQVGDSVFHEILETFKIEHEKSSEFLGIDRNGKKKIRVTYCVRI